MASVSVDEVMSEDEAGIEASMVRSSSGAHGATAAAYLHREILQYFPQPAHYLGI